MRVAIVSDYFPPVSPGGAELSALHLAQALQPYVDVEIVTTDFGYRPEMPFPVHYVRLSGISRDGSAADDPRLLFSSGVRPFTRNLHYAQFARKLAALASEREFDLIHTQQIGSEVAAYLGRPFHRLPRVTTVRGYRHLAGTWQDDAAVRHGIATGPSRAGVVSRLKHAVPRAAVRSGAHLFAVSEFVRSAYIANGLSTESGSSSVFNILPAVEPSVADIEQANRLLSGVYGPVLLFAGRLTDGKGLAMLMDSMMYVLRQVPEVTLVVAGGGDAQRFRSRASANMASYGVRFVGHVPNGVTRALLRRASAAVMPSLHHEPLGRVLLESIAAGVPVVATPYGGTPEVIEHRKNGLLVDPVEPELLADALLTAVKSRDLSTSTRQFDAELVAGRLNPMRTVEATFSAYVKTLAA